MTFSKSDGLSLEALGSIRRKSSYRDELSGIRVKSWQVIVARPSK
jgi:hypothetical protein